MHCVEQAAGEGGRTGPDLTTYPEKDLVALAKSGDDEAFQELLGRSRYSCLRIAAAILRTHEDAEDEVQNAFLKAYKYLPLFNGQSTFSTWVTRIVINHCLMRYRRSKRIQFLPYDALSAEGDWYIAFEPTSGDSPEDELGDAEVRTLLRFELSRIPFLLRAPIELCHVQGLSLSQVASQLGISVAATKSRLHRGQEYLRARMLQHCGNRGLGTLTRVA
jgi:RNA polymerase sigma-70 factor (ECF subfamily)